MGDFFIPSEIILKPYLCIKTFKNMKKFSDFLKFDEILLVTHSGLCHADDAATAGLLSALLEFEGKETKIVRTRDYKELDDLKKEYGERLIVFDVFNSPLDHHNHVVTSFPDKRPLAAIGLTWRWVKDHLIEKYEISPKDWDYYDKNLIGPIDLTDNTGVMNPLNLVFNLFRDTEPGTEDEKFYKFTEYFKALFVKLLIKCNELGKSRKRYTELEVRKLDNFTYRFDNVGNTRSFITEDSECDLYVAKTRTSTYRVSANTDKARLLRIEDPRVIFVHKNGFYAEITDLSVLTQIIEKRDRH